MPLSALSRMHAVGGKWRPRRVAARPHRIEFQRDEIVLDRLLSVEFVALPDQAELALLVAPLPQVRERVVVDTVLLAHGPNPSGAAGVRPR